MPEKIYSQYNRKENTEMSYGDMTEDKLERFVPRTSGAQTTTKLALSAIDQLKRAKPAIVKEAITTISNKNKSGADLMEYVDNSLNRKDFNEVFSELAEGWSEKTIKTFISAPVFQMESGKPDVMDSIVSIAILNDPDLESELRAENMPVTTEQNLLEDRRIVWQYPPPGTQIDPPYLVMVAIESQDSAAAVDVVESIMQELGTYQGFKLPKTTIAKLPKRVRPGKGPILDKNIKLADKPTMVLDKNFRVTDKIGMALDKNFRLT
jgi:hypothetical protein